MPSPAFASEGAPFQFGSERIGPAVALGFFFIGILCLIAALSILFIHPQIAGGEPYRTEVISYAALVSFGFVGSFVFGAAYIISPSMAASRLFSERLTIIHLLLHAIGIGWLIVTYGGMQFLENPKLGFFVGIGLLLLGELIFILNLFKTASRLNHWEPEQLTLMAALFWLGITAVLGVSLLLAPWMPAALHDPLELLQAHAPLGLVGFLWLSLLGFSLKLFNLFLVSEKTAGVLSWIGWIGVNAAMMIFVPVLLYNQGVGTTAAMALLCVGSLFYLADIVRLWLAARRPVGWALTGAFVGLLSGFALLAWALVGMPFAGATADPLEIREVTFVFFIVGIFGSFTLTMLGLSMRLIPLLIWQLRYAPSAGREMIPPPDDFIGHHAGVGLIICLVAASIYLAMGQWTQSVVGTQLGAVCLFCGLYWFLWSLRPSLKAFVFGIPPAIR